MSLAPEIREGVGVNSDTIRFRLAGGRNPLILVPVFLDGKGPYAFILDTGASHCLLSPELSETLGVRPEAERQGMGAAGPVRLAFARVASLAIGSAQRDNLQVAITNELNRIAAVIGHRVDGVLGFEFLKEFAVTIDYQAGSLGLAPSPEAGNGTPADSIPFQLAAAHKPLILVPAVLNDQGPFQFALDTGASRTVLSSSLATQLALETGEGVPGIGGGGQLRISEGRVNLLAVGNAVARNHSVGIGEFLTTLSEVVGARVDGILGYNFLNQFRVTIHYPQGILELAPRHRTPAR